MSTAATATIASGGTLQGSIVIPGDKSISHRALMFGAFASGETVIEGILTGADCQSTAACLRALGAEISELRPEKVIVRGQGRLQEPLDILDVGNSGTTIRLLIGALAAQPDCFFAVTGDASLRSRPMQRVVQPLQAMGAQIWGRTGSERAPLAIQGQRLQGRHYTSPVASAQVKSCLLLAGLYADGITSITEPSRSRDHSERMLRGFGATVEVDGTTVSIRGGQALIGQQVVVPGDISSAAFWLVAGALGGDLEVRNVGINPTRTGVLDALALMGAQIELLNVREIAGEPIADLRVQTSQLKGCQLGGELIPRAIDEIPILAVAALFAAGKTTIRDAAELRVKESDRLAVMARELTKLGARITELPDGLEIEGGHPLTGATVAAHHDHRIAMSLAIAALHAKGETTIEGAEAIAVSYPDFLATLERLRHP